MPDNLHGLYFFQGFFGLFKENCVFLKNKMDKYEALKSFLEEK